MSKLPIVNRYLAGNRIITQQIVRKDGSIATVTIEQYDIGFMFLIHSGDHYCDSLTNHVAYPTTRKAINAAARATI